MDAYGYPARDLSDAGVRVRFHRNEAAIPPPQPVVDAIRSLDGNDLRCYPVEAQRRLVDALAASFGTEAECVALGNGADEILCALGRATLQPGDEGVFLSPSFGMYERSIVLARATPVPVPYRTQWSIDAHAVIAHISPRTRLIVLGNPNNPTGDVPRVSDVEAIASAAPQAIVAIDEVYLAFSDRRMWEALRSHKNVAFVRSLSKSAALAGMRVGFCIASESLAARIRAQVTPYPLSVASLAAANAYLENDAARRAYEIALEAQRQRSLDAIENAIAPIARVWRGTANFLLADFGAKSESLLRTLTSCGIAVRTFADPRLQGFVRFCAGSDEDTDELLAGVRASMREYVDA